jgi:hypothetical protein
VKSGLDYLEFVNIFLALSGFTVRNGILIHRSMVQLGSDDDDLVLET